MLQTEEQLDEQEGVASGAVGHPKQRLIRLGPHHVRGHLGHRDGVERLEDDLSCALPDELIDRSL